MTKELQQGTDAWLEARVGKITGSRVGAILGVSKYKTRDDVMREMVREHFGAEREFTGNQFTEYGNEHEPVARQDFEIEYGHDVQEVGFIVHPEYDWLGVSPDGLIGDDDGVEIKCPHSQKIDGVFTREDYLFQNYLCLVVTGREKWHHYTWTPDNKKCEVVHAKQAKLWFEQNLKTLKAFYDEYQAIIADEELAKPYLAPLEVDMSDDDEWSQAVEQFEQAKQLAIQAKKAETEAKTILQNLAVKQGVKRVRCNGVTVSKATRQGTIKYSDIPELKSVDLEQYRGKPTEYWVIK